MKTCKTCSTAKPADALHFRPLKNRHGTAYLKGECLDCERTRAKTRMDRLRVENPEQVQQAKRKHRASDHGRQQHAKTAREAKARKAGFESHAQWLEARHRARLMRQLAEAIRRIGRKKAAEERRLAPWMEPGIGSAEKYRRQYRLDPEFNLKERIRRQIRKATKRDGIAEDIRQAMLRNGSSSKVEHMLGYTIAKLRVHLERQFLGGMGWHNYGQWHIDHIIPQRMFDMSDEQQWRKCWCMSNLRPMWGRDNLSKAGRVQSLL